MHRRFYPPLKQASATAAPSASQESCSSSLPTTQTHTVLSYCEETVTDLVEDAVTDLVEDAVTIDTLSKDGHKARRKYNYSMLPHHKTKPKCPPQPAPKSWSASAGKQGDVYEYQLTPSEQKRKKTKNTRKKEQARC